MMLLYKDPDGETIFEKSHATSSLDGKAGTILSTLKAGSDLENKITSLQKKLKEKDDTIVQLKSEIVMMKV